MLVGSLAQAQTLQECVDQANFIDPHVGKPIIQDECKNTIVNAAFKDAIDYSSDNYVQVFAAGNILYTVNYENDGSGNTVRSVDGLSAGKYTSFNNIAAVELDEATSQVFILDQEEDGSYSVLSVPSNVAGSIAPKTKLQLKEISDARNIKVDRNNNELFVIGSNWIKVFNADAYTGSFRDDQNADVQRSVQGNNTNFLDIRDIAIAGDHIYVLDSDRVLKYPRVSSLEDVEPLGVVSVPAGESIDFDGAKLVVTNDDGSTTDLNL